MFQPSSCLENSKIDLKERGYISMSGSCKHKEFLSSTNGENFLTVLVTISSMVLLRGTSLLFTRMCVQRGPFIIMATHREDSCTT
jgi:hypothetical protein